MLFRVYSRYVPNLTRNDGSAMDRLLTSSFVGTPVSQSKPTPQAAPHQAVPEPDTATAVAGNTRKVRAAPLSANHNGENLDAQPPPIGWADLAKSWMSNDSSFDRAA